MKLAQTLNLFQACGSCGCALSPGTRVQVYGLSSGGLVTGKIGRRVTIQTDGGELLTRDQNEVYPETNGDQVNIRRKMETTGYDDRTRVRVDPVLMRIGRGPMFPGLHAEFGPPGMQNQPGEVEPVPQNDVPSLRDRQRVMSDEEETELEEKVMPSAARARKEFREDRLGWHQAGLQTW